MMQKIWAQHKKVRKNNKGFSLVELIIVIAIMAALVAVLAPQYIKYVERSRETGDQNTCAEMLHAVQVSAVDPGYTGTLPASVTFTCANSKWSITAPAAGEGGTVATDFNVLVNSVIDLNAVEMKSTDGKAFTALTVEVGANGVNWDETSATAVAKLNDGVANTAAADDKTT